MILHSVNADYHKCPYGFSYGTLPYHRTGVGGIHCQLYSETAKIYAGCIGIWQKCRLIDILWVKVLIFQGAKPIFNVGSLSNKSKKEKLDVKKCPQEKVEYIQDALKHFNLI